MKYRAEIDGLRALAVIPVILFHAGFESFSGGFLGVDIFFVISGYLITTIIIQELETGSFSLSHFYSRRVRRIFPALAVMTLICVPLAWIWLPPGEMKEFSQSLIGVATFSSNFFFWQQSGYFDTTAELKPLLHTWSLAVEEQYYIFFPFAILLFWRFGKAVLCSLCLLAFLVSLGLAQWASINASTANFFLLPTRGWELMLGVFCAFYVQWRVRSNNENIATLWAQQILSILGAGMIVFAVLAFNPTTPTPSIWTLVPTVGAVLIILYANTGTWIKSILGWKPLVWIGLISYSAYLWHQPIFVFYRYSTLVEPSAIVMIGLSLASLLAGWFSWRFIERPFRIKGYIPTGIVYGLAGFFCILIILLGVQGHRSGGFPDRSSIKLPTNLDWASLGAKVKAKGDVCDLEVLPDTNYVLGCEFGDTNSDKTIVLYGDSHAQAISYALNETLLQQKIKGLRLNVYECADIPYIRQNGNLMIKDCDKRYEEFLSYVKNLSTDVIVINRWTFRLYPLEGYDVTMPYKNSAGNVENDNYRQYAVYDGSRLAYDAETKAKYLKMFVEKLAGASNRLFLVYPVPEMALDISRANILYRNRTGHVLQDISIPYSDYLSRNEFVLSVFNDIKAGNITAVKPADIFCDSYEKERCVAQYKSTPYYLDDDHLSDVGAQMIVDRILERNDNPLKK